MKTLLIIAMLVGSSLVHAEEFSVLQTAKSSISFVSKQMSVPVNGKFGRFNAQITFDPNKTANGKARIEIDMSSIDAGSEEANDEVKGKDWFNIKEFATAKFESTGIKAGGGRYEASGKLTIKNVTRNVNVPFIAKIEAGSAVLEGGIQISRQQFGIGTGEWADVSTVADEVQLHFKLAVATAKK
ncbi:MAG TPA: YceI family protein [Novimethylophilus sp.]|jgi:polyisoprenoid-binding protein YceI|uniref:YceI family protein n=1 Tax=Novimethylophilus sp. TaxID=2137426 RepID=UPI002F40FFA0